MASAVIGALRVDLGINSAQFSDGLRKAQQSLAGIGKSMTRIGTGMSAAITAPIVAFGMSTLRVAGDFEAAMNRVGAATGASSSQIEAMSKLALQLGTDTSKSASESADMMEMLAKNGLNAQQILDGAAAAAIALSEATGGDLSRSADVATNVMAQFNLQVSDLPKIVDQITASTLNSQFGFEDYALALAQAGGVAGGLGVTIEDFNTVVTATADTFNSGSDAGTSFKTFLLSLTPTTKKARAAMEELGLEFFDAQGNMKSMADIAEELKTSFAGLSDTEISQNMKTIFGTDSMRTAIALMDQGKAGLDAVKEGILQQGVAAEQQAARMKGLNGELEKLAGAWESLKIAIAQSGILEAMTSMISKVAEFVAKLAQTNPEMLKWGTAIAAIAAALGPVVLSVGLLVTAIAAIGVPVAAAVAGFTALTAALVAFWPQILQLETTINNLVLNGFNALVASLTALGETIMAFIANAWAQLLAAWDQMVAKIAEVKAALVEFAQSIPALFEGLAARMYQIGVDIINGLLNGLKAAWNSVTSWASGAAARIEGFFRNPLGANSPSTVMYGVGVDIMTGLQQGMQSMEKGIGDFAQSLGQTIGSAFQGVIDGSKSVKEAIADVLKSLAKMLMDRAFQMLFSGLGGGGGFGGFFKGLLGGLFGFASGGSFMVGGAGGIDSQLVAFKASPNERVSVTKPNQERQGNGIADVRVWVDENGNWQARVEQISRRTSTPIVQQGLAQYDRQLDKTLHGKLAQSQARVL